MELMSFRRISFLAAFYLPRRSGLDPSFMKSAKKVKGIDAMPAIIKVTRMDVGSYGALNNGRKGIGNNTQIQRNATTVSNFHLFLILSSKNETKVM